MILSFPDSLIAAKIPFLSLVGKERPVSTDPTQPLTAAFLLPLLSDQYPNPKFISLASELSSITFLIPDFAPSILVIEASVDFRKFPSKSMNTP